MEHRRGAGRKVAQSPDLGFFSPKVGEFLTSAESASLPPSHHPNPPPPPNGCGFLWPVLLARQLFRLMYRGDRIASGAKDSSCRYTIFMSD